LVFEFVGNGIFWARAVGDGRPQLLLQRKTTQILPWSFTPDGKRLAYYEIAVRRRSGRSHKTAGN
jgi:hypothetical protein